MSKSLHNRPMAQFVQAFAVPIAIQL